MALGVSLSTWGHNWSFTLGYILGHWKGADTSNVRLTKPIPPSSSRWCCSIVSRMFFFVAWRCPLSWYSCGQITLSMNSSILPVLVLHCAVFRHQMFTVLCYLRIVLSWLVESPDVCCGYSVHSLLCSVQMGTFTFLLGPPNVKQHHVTMSPSHFDSITSHYSASVCCKVIISRVLLANRHHNRNPNVYPSTSLRTNT